MARKFTLCALMAAAIGASAVTPPVEPTTIADGKFADNTQWVTMRIAAAGYLIYDQGTASYVTLSRTTTKFADEDLWCFVGDEANGYALYNKAAGTAKQFAAPSSPAGSDQGGSAYPILQAPGVANQTYLWDFTTSTNLGDDGYYLNEHGAAANKINNRQGKLAFWTAGADAGSTLKFASVIDAEFGAVEGNSVVVSTNPLVKLNGPSAPTVNADGSLTLGAGTWTFSTPEGYVVNCASVNGSDATATLGLSNDENAITGPVTITSLRFTLAEQRVIDGKIVFRYDGTPGYTVQYRIPTIVTVLAGEHKGRLIALNDYRYSGADIGAGRIDLYMSISDDNGETWTAPDHMRGANGQPVAQGTGATTPAGTKQCETNLDCGYGDPATVCDRETGEILAVACCGRMGFFASTRNDPQPSCRWWSKDGGQTWTEPDYGQWEQIYALFDGTCAYGSIDGQFVGSGRMVQSSRIKVGSHYRIYCVMSGRNIAAGNISNWVLYSDDFGHNWHILGGGMHPAIPSVADEPKCEELPDGSILLAARGNGGNRNFNIFRYTDIEKAEGLWGSHINTNLGIGSTINACNGEIMIVPVKNTADGTQAYMALQSYPAGPGRANVSIAWKVLDDPTKYDEPSDFATWDGHFKVSKLGSAYSTMTWTGDNAIGFLYEEETLGRAYCEVYRHITIEELTDGAWEYCPDTDRAVAIAQTKQMVANRSAIEPGKCVGQLNADGVTLVQTAAATYNENPTEENYVAFNNAVLHNPHVIQPEANKTYTFRSMHGGLSGYPEKDRWLSATVSKLSVSTKNTGEYVKFQLIPVGEGSENFYLYSPGREKWVASTPTAIETAIDMSADAKGEYTFDMSNGTVAVVCATPGMAANSAVHMKGSGAIVAWLPTSPASRWEMEAVAEEDGIAEINADAKGDTKYYDLQGRRVRNPRRGQFLITSDRTRIAF